MTVAMERICGEIRIADFDTLSLSNLNRMRSSLHDIGQYKSVLVAREIAEMDPYIKVQVFHDGINKDNVEAFFTEGGALDLLFEECDGIDVKILARLKAKELGVPVVMETSDNGLLDIERFDKEKDRPIMHGYMAGLDLSPDTLASLSTEEKVAYVLPMLGVDNLSVVSKASMLEINQTLESWPQLASSVALGGAVCTDVGRKILLDELHQSGRYSVDLNKIINDEPSIMVDNDEQDKNEEPSLSSESLSEPDQPPAVEWQKLAQLNAPKAIKLDHPAVERLVAAAHRAPSTGNLQPWQWHYHEGVLGLYKDHRKIDRFGNVDDINTNLSLGAAIENLVLTAHEMQLEAEVTLQPDAAQSDLAASVSFYAKGDTTPKENHDFDGLHQFIDKRQTNRLNEVQESINGDVLLALDKVIDDSEFSLQFVHDRDEMDKLGTIIGRLDRLRFLHEEGHCGMFSKEMRWTEADAKARGDGVDINSFDVKPADVAALRIAAQPQVRKLLNEWNGGSAFIKMAQDTVRSSAAIGFMRGSAFNQASYLKGGRYMERL